MARFLFHLIRPPDLVQVVNLWRHKDKVDMQIPDWMITEEMKHISIIGSESSAPKRSTVIHFCLPKSKSTRLTPPAPVPTVDKADEMILQDTLQPRSDKESQEVEITNDKEVEITNVVIPVNVNEEEEEITDEVYEFKRREKGMIVEESRSTPFPTPIRSPRIHTDLVSSDTEKL
ncbi:hypothetical protein Tco_1454097 [Tanacetum coccineum]